MKTEGYMAKKDSMRPGLLNCKEPVFHGNSQAINLQVSNGHPYRDTKVQTINTAKLYQYRNTYSA